MNIAICSDLETIKKLKNMGLKVFKEENNMTHFLLNKEIKLNFDLETMKKIHFSNKMTF